MMGRLPRTTGLGIVAGAAVGTIGLALHRPVVVVAALAGVFLGAGIAGISGSLRRIVISSGLLPLGLLGVVAAVWVAWFGWGAIGDMAAVFEGEAETRVAAGILGCLAVVLGLGTVGTTTDGLSTRTVSKAAKSTLVATGVAAVLSTVVYLLATALTLRSLLLPGTGYAGLVWSVIMATIALAVAVLVIPPAAVTSPGRRDGFVEWKNGVALLVVVGGILTAVGAFVLVLLVRVPALVIDPIVGGPMAALRGLFVVLTLVGVVIASFSLAVRWSWNEMETDHNDVVPAIGGSICGLLVLVPATLVLGFDPGVLFVIPVVLGAASASLYFVSWTANWWTGEDIVSGTVGVPRGIAAALVVSGIVVATSIDGTATVPGWSGVGAMVAIATGLFTYTLGLYGGTLADEVGREGATRRPQFVQIAWTGTIATFGAGVAVAGLWTAMLVAPSLSVQATLGVVTGLVAAVLGTWVLFQRAR